MAGKKGEFELLVVGMMTHSLLVVDPPNDPQYGVERLARVHIERFGGHQSVTAWVLAWCSRPWWPVRQYYKYLWPMCFFFISVPIFIFV